MESEITKKAQNPYIGPFSFDAGDENRFFGRNKETVRLIEMIQQRQLTVLFGASGTGKTSLIHAKLFPELERLYFQPVYIRINFSTGDPLEFVRKRIVSELRTWEVSMPEFADGQSLINYAAKNNVFKGLVKPVLFFDQFEELFTIGYKNDRDKIDLFIKELGDLIEMRLPDELRSSISLENIVKFKVVLSLRQDWIAFLEDYSNEVPSLLQNRFRLRRFVSSQAMEAIMSPCNRNDLSIISESTAKKIILKIGKPSLMWDGRGDDAELKNIAIDPIVLSIYCYQLYELAKRKTPIIIDDALVESNTDTFLIRTYYEQSMKGNESMKELIENNLLNESGIRLTIPLNILLEKSNITAGQIRDCAKKTGVVRLTGRTDSPDVEIIHDKVASQIFDSRREREIKQNELEINKEANEEKKKANKLRKYTIIVAITSAALIFSAFLGTNIYIKNHTDIDRLNRKVSEKDSVNIVLEELNGKLVKKNDYFTTSIWSLEKQIDYGNNRFYKDSLILIKQITDGKNEMKKMALDIQNLVEKNLSLTNERMRLNQRINNLMQDSIGSNENINNLDLRVSSLRNDSLRLEERISGLTNERSQLNSTIINLNLRINNLKDDSANSVGIKRDLNKRISSLKNDSTRFDGTIIQLLEKLKGSMNKTDTSKDNFHKN